MHTINYRNTFIEISPDSALDRAKAPARPGTVAALQHALLQAHPGQMTSDEVLVAVEATRREVPPDEVDVLRAEIFAKPQACFRASPLVKSHGFGLYHDDQARVTLVPRESADYDRYLADPSVAKCKGMRSSRA